MEIETGFLKTHITSKVQMVNPLLTARRLRCGPLDQRGKLVGMFARTVCYLYNIQSFGIIFEAAAAILYVPQLHCYVQIHCSATLVLQCNTLAMKCLVPSRKRAVRQTMSKVMHEQTL